MLSTVSAASGYCTLAAHLIRFTYTEFFSMTTRDCSSDCSADVENHAYHNGRDCYGRQMTPGTYMMTQPGHKPVRVIVSEDELSGDLGFSVYTEQLGGSKELGGSLALPNKERLGGSRELGGSLALPQQRVEDCAANVTFSRISEAACEAERLLESMRQILNGADEARRDLDAFEAELCQLLGCGVGDGSHLSDLAMAAVRDGMGTPYSLLQAAGQDVQVKE